MWDDESTYLVDHEPYMMRPVTRPSLLSSMCGVELILKSSDYNRTLPIKGLDATVERSIDAPARFTIRIPEKEFSALAGRMTVAQRWALNSFYGIPKLYPIPKKVIYNYPATIVFWDDGTKTVVKHHKSEIPDLDTAIAYAVCKKIYGNMSHFDKLFTRDAEVVIQKEKEEPFDIDALKKEIMGTLFIPLEKENEIEEN